MKLSELKQIIMECISEVIEEGGGTRFRKSQRRNTKGYKWKDIQASSHTKKQLDYLDPKSHSGGIDKIRYRRDMRDKYSDVLGQKHGGAMYIATPMGGGKKASIKARYDDAAKKSGVKNGILRTYRNNRKLPG